jgi:hypothetical protein
MRGFWWRFAVLLAVTVALAVIAGVLTGNLLQGEY